MMTLVDIVSSRGKAEILRILFGLEGRERHLRELVRQSGLAVRTIQIELANLAKNDLVTARRDGNRLYYRANRNNPVYSDLHNIVIKTDGLAKFFHDALQRRGVTMAFVFGSMAAGAATFDSDVDLMIIGTEGLRQVSQMLSGVSEKIGREINPHVLTPEEFSKRRKESDHFISSVLASPRLFVVGSEHELAELDK